MNGIDRWIRRDLRRERRPMIRVVMDLASYKKFQSSTVIFIKLW